MQTKDELKAIQIGEALGEILTLEESKEPVDVLKQTDVVETEAIEKQENIVVATVEQI